MIKITNKKTEKPHVPQKIIEQPTRKVMKLCKDIAYIEKELKKITLNKKLSIEYFVYMFYLINKRGA